MSKSLTKEYKLGQIKKWQADNQEKVQGYQRKWRAKNSEKVQKYQMEWYANNRENIAEHKKRWYAKNSEKVREHRLNSRFGSVERYEEAMLKYDGWCAFGCDKAELVHHLDGKSVHNSPIEDVDNNLKNLIPLCNSCHTKLHKWKRRKTDDLENSSKIFS